MRQAAIILLLILLLCPLASAQVDWCDQVNTLYFQHSNSPDIPGYEELRNYPSGAMESDENVTITSADGLVLIDTYITPPGEPAITAFDVGLRRYRTYHYVDKTIGTTRFLYRTFLRHVDGTETSLYEIITEDVDGVIPTEYLTSYVIANKTAVLPTDRIGISVFVNTTSSAEVYAHFVYEGDVHHSHIESGYYSCDPPPPAPTIPNLPAPPLTDPGVPWYTWVICAAIVIILVRVIP